jgi:hypothetical protein
MTPSKQKTQASIKAMNDNLEIIKQAVGSRYPAQTISLLKAIKEDPKKSLVNIGPAENEFIKDNWNQREPVGEYVWIGETVEGVLDKEVHHHFFCEINNPEIKERRKSNKPVTGIWVRDYTTDTRDRIVIIVAKTKKNGKIINTVRERIGKYDEYGNEYGGEYGAIYYPNRYMNNEELHMNYPRLMFGSVIKCEAIQIID